MNILLFIILTFIFTLLIYEKEVKHKQNKEAI